MSDRRSVEAKVPYNGPERRAYRSAMPVFPGMDTAASHGQPFEVAMHVNAASGHTEIKLEDTFALPAKRNPGPSPA